MGFYFISLYKADLRYCQSDTLDRRCRCARIRCAKCSLSRKSANSVNNMCSASTLCPGLTGISSMLQTTCASSASDSSITDKSGNPVPSIVPLEFDARDCSRDSIEGGMLRINVSGSGMARRYLTVGAVCPRRTSATFRTHAAIWSGLRSGYEILGTCRARPS